MPTYEDLRAFFEETSGLRQAAAAATRIPIVTGITLDVDPLWSLLYDEEYGLIEWPPIDPRRFEIPTDLSELDVWVFESGISSTWMATRYQGFRRRNPFKPVKRWIELTEKYRARTSRNRLPVFMTIVYRPLRAPVKGEGDDLEALRQLVALVHEYNLGIRLEERPPARLALAGGDKIVVGGTKSGTFGGLLRDSASGTEYGVTCSHVAAAGDNVSDAANPSIGKCVADTARVVLPAGKRCDPVTLAVPNPYPGNGPEVNMLDCSLIAMSIKATGQSVAAIAPSLTQGQNVVLHGAITKTTRHKLGSLCISYQFTQAGQDYCFRDAIELVPQPWGPLGGPLGHMMTTVPQQGDSGGWVLTDTQPADWAGLFFGEDGTRGFAIRATWVHQWAERAVHATLTV